MAETVVSNPRGAEISERTREFVLPDEERPAQHADARPMDFAARDGRGGSAVSESDLSTADRSASSEPRAAASVFPGDRGNRSRPASTQRPSFWRRIALGRRASEPEVESKPMQSVTPAEPPQAAKESAAVRTASLVERAREVVAPSAPPPTPIDARALEVRIMEPMLQALVSVEAKLERSHGELMGRSDHVEQRLTQLWDIEEQLGALGELQESLLQVSEQQRRLESAIVGQTRTLRWLIGAVFFSLAAAAFVVAAIR